MSQKRLRKNRNLERSASVNPGVVKETRNVLPGVVEIIKNNWVFLLLTCLVSLVLYANALNGAFVSDDYATVPNNPLIGDFWATMKSFPGNSMSLSNYVVFKLFGYSSPVPYHVTSLLIYMLVLVLVFIFVEIVFKNRLLSQVATLIFTFHPIHVEAVSWNAGRIYLILSVYMLLSVINLIYFLDRDKSKYLVYGMLFFLLAILTDRPRPFAIFLIMILYVVSQQNWDILKKYKNYAWLVLAGLVVSVLISLPLINHRIETVNGGVNASTSIFYNPILQYPVSMAKYLQLLWMPLNLTLYHTMYVLPSWLNWLITLNYLALLVYFYIKDKRYFFALTFIFVATAPSMAPVKVSWLVAERYMFLGSLGFCLFLALILTDLWKKSKFLSPLLLVLLLAFYGWRVYQRNIDWSTNHNLWVNTCQVSPNSHNAWNNIGDDYDKLGQYENSIKGFTQSVLVKPNYADAYHNRGNVLYKIKRPDLAKESYETAVNINPNLYQTYLALAQIAFDSHDPKTAKENLEKYMHFDATNVQAYYSYALAQAQLGEIEEAKQLLQQILTVYPNLVPVKESLKVLESGISFVPW